jgi:hypothetical protein
MANVKSRFNFSQSKRKNLGFMPYLHAEGQGFRYVLRYQIRFYGRPNDFALEFYSFIDDNFASFFSLPMFILSQYRHGFITKAGLGLSLTATAKENDRSG